MKFAHVNWFRFTSAATVAVALVAAPLAAQAVAPSPTAPPLSTTSSAADATPASSDSESAQRIYEELNTLALTTAGEAAAGYAATSSVTERYVTDDTPWLAVNTLSGLRWGGETHPKISFDRTVVVDEEYIYDIPYTNRVWGGVGLGGYASGNYTQGWEALPAAEASNSATAALLDRLGNPQRVIGRVGAASDWSPLSIPYSVPEANEWSKQNGITPWGVIIGIAERRLISVSSAEKTDHGTYTQYQLTFRQEWTKSFTLTAIAQDGLLVRTDVTARFDGYSPEEPDVEVQQRSDLTWIGLNAPLPGPELDSSVVRMAHFTREAAKETVRRLHAKATARISSEIGEASLTQGNALAAFNALVASDGSRWYRLGDDQVNEWSTPGRIVDINGIPTIQVSAQIMSLRQTCTLPLSVIDGGGEWASGITCRTHPTPVVTSSPSESIAAESHALNGVEDQTWRPLQRILPETLPVD